MNRERISMRGLAYILLAEWPAKLCILLPVVLAGLNPGAVVRSILFGALLWCLVIAGMQRWMKPEQDFPRTVEACAGRKAAVSLCVAGLSFFLMYTAVFTRLWAELLRICLRPGIPAAVLCVLPLAAGLVFLGKGLDSRARVSRRAGIALLVLTAGLACLAGNEIPIGAYDEAAAGAAQIGAHSTAPLIRDADGFLRSAFEVFLCMGGMFLPFLQGQTEDTGERHRAARTIRLNICACAALAGAFCMADSVFLTAQEQWAADFPAFEAMRRLRPFGQNVGRLETVLALLLTAGLTMTVAGGIWHVRAAYDYLYAAAVEFFQGAAFQRFWRRLRDRGESEKDASRNAAPEGGELFGVEFAEELSDPPERRGVKFYGVRMTKKLSGLPGIGRISCYGGRISESLTAGRIWWWITVLAVYALAVGFADAFAALTFYRAYNMQICVPAMLIFYAVIAAKKLLQWRKRVCYTD